MKNIIICAALISSLFSLPPIHAEEKGFFSTMFDDLKSSGVKGVLQRKEIREWYKNNKGKLVIVTGSETLGCEKKEFSDLYDCSFSAELVNHTNNELRALVLNIKAYNKPKNALVTEEIATLNISIYPTVKNTIKAQFISKKIGNARSQLGKNFAWNYELIAYLPDHLHGKFEDPDWFVNSAGVGRNKVYDWLAE